MRVVTIVSLGACALFGLGALVVANTMLPKGATAKIAPVMAGVPVVVAKAPLKFGDRLDASKVEILNLPANAIPEGSFTNVAQVLKQDNGLAPVALTAIAAREPLLPAKLSGPGARPSLAVEIAEGMRAYTIKVSDVTGVGGHALPGDHVDVVLMRDLTPQGSIRTYVSEVVIQNVRVLGVDLNADQTANKPATPSTATLEVTVPDAQKLAVAGDLGKLSLALRKTGAAEIAQTAPMRTGNFVSGGGGGGGGGGSGSAHAPAHHGGAAPAVAGQRLIVIVEGAHGARSHAPRARPAAPPAPMASSADNASAATATHPA